MKSKKTGARGDESPVSLIERIDTMRDPALLYHYLAVVSRIERLLTESKSAVLPLYETTVINY